MKRQEKEAKRIDRMVAKKMKAAKKKLKRAIAGKMLKITAFLAVAAGVGVVAAKGKDVVIEKISLLLKEISLKMKAGKDNEKEWDVPEEKECDAAEEEECGNPLD